MKVLKYVALAYFILFLALSSRTMERHNCISSTIVKEIDINHPNNLVQIPNCYGKETIKGTLVLDDQKLLKSIQENVQSLENVIYNNKLFMPYKKITIALKAGGSFDVSSSRVLISPDLIQNSTEFQKAVVRAWMMNFSSADVRSDKFLQTIFADIYSFLFWNERLEDVSQIETHWVRYFYSEREVCHSKLTTPDQKLFCDTLNTTKSKNFEDLSIWSLRPFVLAQFYQIYDESNLKQKTNFIQQITRAATNFHWNHSYDHLNLKQIAVVYDDLMKKILPEGGSLPQASFRLDSVIDGAKTATAISEDKIEGNTLIVKSNDIYWNPANHSLLRLKDVEAKKWFVFRQSFPKLQELAVLPSQTVTIFVPHQDALQVHVPSLQLLSRYRDYGVLNMSIAQALHSHKIEEILGWNPVQVY